MLNFLTRLLGFCHITVRLKIRIMGLFLMCERNNEERETLTKLLYVLLHPNIIR